ncbi:MAG TPA: cytidine deaminase [Friedmanniella sp.]
MSAEPQSTSPLDTPDDPEDVKIITLARSALARTGAPQGACVRDTDGRTYAATSVALEHLSLSAVAVAVAMAASSGAEGLEAVALATNDEPDPYALEGDLDVVRDLGGEGVAVWAVDPRGVVRGRVLT